MKTWHRLTAIVCICSALISSRKWIFSQTWVREVGKKLIVAIEAQTTLKIAGNFLSSLPSSARCCAAALESQQDHNNELLLDSRIQAVFRSFQSLYSFSLTFFFLHFTILSKPMPGCHGLCCVCEFNKQTDSSPFRSEVESERRRKRSTTAKRRRRRKKNNKQSWNCGADTEPTHTGRVFFV